MGDVLSGASVERWWGVCIMDGDEGIRESGRWSRESLTVWPSSDGFG
jgi:hypothetical protein